MNLFQDIAVARGPTYDTLNKRMDRCQASIESISDDIQRFQGDDNDNDNDSDNDNDNDNDNDSDSGSDSDRDI